MTLVLSAAFCGDQIANSYVHHRAGSARNASSMPCVFDGEPLDFESALMTDWPSDIGDYDTTEESVKTPSGSCERDLKRKTSPGLGEGHTTELKKPRIDDDDEVLSPPSETITPSSPQQHPVVLLPHHHAHVTLPPSPLTSSHSSLESNSSSSSSDGQEEEAVEDDDEEEFLPRRRVVPQMWNSRQRWKDERKKVLKMSIGKLAEIEDPELWLLRSVLINNTIKKLHLDIRNERQAKLRHRQQRMDFFAERYHSLSTSPPSQPVLTSSPSDHRFQEDETSTPPSSGVANHHQTRKSSVSDLYDDTSCDEIFGISEDFLRVTIPDRRVSSPLPNNPVPGSPSRSESPMDTGVPDESMDNKCVTTGSSYSPSSPPCDIGSSSAFYRPRTTLNTDASSSPNPHGDPSPTTTSSSNRRHIGSMVSATSGGIQCATQFRTNCGAGGCGGGVGDSTFPPRVPILDSVVYHSLLASLESS